MVLAVLAMTAALTNMKHKIIVQLACTRTPAVQEFDQRVSIILSGL